MIDTNAIRNRLIYLAISGELVEQNADEGNANELIEKLSYEVNNASPCSNIDIDKIPNEIPSSWAWCRLSDIGSTNIGLTYHPEDMNIDGVPVLRSNNIKNYRMVFDNLIRVTCEIHEKQFINKNDILICARNGSKNLVGKCAIYNGDLGEASFGAFMAVYRTTCFEYVYYYFQTKLFRRYFENENNKQINQVTQNILKNAVIPLPPFEEQKRIVAKLKETFEILDTIDELQAFYNFNLEVLKGKLIDAGIQGKLTQQLPEDGTAEELYQQIQDEKKELVKAGMIKKEKLLPDIIEKEIPFQISGNWKWVRLRDICTKIVDGDHNPPASVKEKTEYLMLSAQNINYDRLVNIETARYMTEDTFIEVNKRTRLEKDDILLTIVATLGRSCVYREELNACFQRSVCVISTLINPDYLKRYFDSTYVQKFMKDNATGAAQPGFYLNKVEKLCIPLPPMSEQIRIVSRLEQILQLIPKEESYD